MTDNEDIKGQSQKSGSVTSTIGTIVIGVVLGAAALYFSDAQNRKKAQEKLQKAQTWGNDTAKKLTDQAKKLRNQTMDKSEDLADRVSDTLEENSENLAESKKALEKNESRMLH